MRHYLGKVGLLLSPFLAMFLVELFILPLDFFTFRCWEALIDSDGSVGLRGGFYPNQHLIKYEAGDRLGFRDPKRLKVEWFTDEYGFRNRPCPNPPKRYDYVLLGDSNIVGSGLDQSETLAEVLARKGKCTAYSYGTSVRQNRLFWSDPRFLKNPPRTIVLESRGLEYYQASALPFVSIEPLELPQSIIPSWARVLRSRARKQNMLQFVKSRLGCSLFPNNAGQADKNLSLSARVEFMVSKVKAMRDEAQRRGSDFIFFLMPDTDRTLDAGIIPLRQAGVKTIAYLPTPEYPHGVDLKWYWQSRDSHWTKEAVELTADEILKLASK